MAFNRQRICWVTSGTIRKKSIPRRNDPCPCGSGKKFKYCCLRRLADERAERLAQVRDARENFERMESEDDL